jgi:hypothetical protein
MEFGLRLILLIVAAVLFLIAVFSTLHQGDLIAAGLLVTVLALCVEGTPFSDLRWGGPRNR